jgi:hypothetical protein
MSYDFVGLENLPNVYIKKITLRDNNDSMAVDVMMLMIDELFEGSFVWSTDPLLYDYLKVAVIATSNAQLIEGITSGQVSAHPKVLRRSPYMSGTNIIEFSPKEANLTRDLNTKRWNKKITFNMPQDTSEATLFALSYIDATEMSKALRIQLTGPLATYYGSVASEVVLESNEIPETSFLYKRTDDNSVWSGPVHQMINGSFMGGSFHDDEEEVTLLREVVKNSKVHDARITNLKQRKKVGFSNAPLFSDLHTSFNSLSDLTGMFSMDFRSLLYNQTEYGRIMFGVSTSFFEEFARSIRINSFEIRRRQIKQTASTNRLGTRNFKQKLIGSYKTIDATVESASGFGNTDKISQIYIVRDPLIKTFQFTDTEMTPRSRGEYRYELVVSFIDGTKEFLRGILLQMERSLSSLRATQEFLFRNSQYDRELDQLKPGIRVPASVHLAIENYFNNKAIVYDINDEEKERLIRNKKKSFTTENYANRSIVNFIGEYSALLTKMRTRFGIQKSDSRFSSVRPNKTTPPNMKIINHVFDSTIQFSRGVASYDIIGRQPEGQLLSLAKEAFTSRANMEVSRFFNTSKSKVSTDLADMEKEDMMAINDLDSPKTAFMSPVAFKFKDETKDLMSLQNLDQDGISSNFITHISEEQADPKFSSKAVRKEKKPGKRRTSTKRRAAIKKRRFGRTKFNFRRSPLKINNLKTEEYLDVSKYLGGNSEMINIENKLDEAIEAPQTKQVEKKILATTGLSVKREKMSYDLQSKNNIFEKFKSSPKFDREKLRMMPISIKSLLNSRSTAAKNNILEAESDILKDPETKIATEMIFQSPQKIEYLQGYETDSNGMPNLKRPMWAELTPQALEANSRLTCRMRYAEIPELGIKPAPELRLQVQNELFMISDGNIFSEMEAPSEVIEEALEIQVDLPEVDDIVYATTNTVVQNSQRQSQIIEVGEANGEDSSYR